VFSVPTELARLPDYIHTLHISIYLLCLDVFYQSVVVTDREEGGDIKRQWEVCLSGSYISHLSREVLILYLQIAALIPPCVYCTSCSRPVEVRYTPRNLL
jgi:hypothetical protein